MEFFLETNNGSYFQWSGLEDIFFMLKFFVQYKIREYPNCGCNLSNKIQMIFASEIIFFEKNFHTTILLHIQFLKSWKIFFASDLWKNDFIISIQLNHANKSPKMKFFFRARKKAWSIDHFNFQLNERCSEWIYLIQKNYFNQNVTSMFLKTFFL